MKQNAQSQFKSFPGISQQVYSREDFQELSNLIHQVAGIVMSPEKGTLIYSRISPLVRDSGQQTFSRYIELIRKDKAELRKTINALTTNHTFFFRERHHFDHLATQVRPMLLDKLRAGKPVRIWSAGCSTGEELYSLTMALLGPDRADARSFLNGDIAILATDLADHAVSAATDGCYPFDTLKDVPTELIRAWTKLDGDNVHMLDEVKNLIRVRRLNLLGQWPMQRPFDVIFCRNVMIYFDQPTKDKLVTRFIDQLLPQGYLYIGHSERACGPSERKLTLVGGTIYRKDQA